MHRTFILPLLIIATLLHAGCSAMNNHPGDDWFGRDKLYHFTACCAIGAGTTAVSLNNGIDTPEAPVAGIGMSIAIGAGKEWYDLGIAGKYWSWKDMVWDIIGGAAGSWAVAGVR